MNSILNFFSDNFVNCIWLAVIIIAMIPTLESKIAIPFAMSVSVWGDLALPIWQAFLFSFLGSIIPCYFVMLMGRFIKRHTTGFVSERIRTKYYVKTSLIDEEKNYFKKYMLLSAFVAVPLPLTGVWTGSLIAGMSNLKTKYSFIAITIGALISSVAITLLCVLLKNSITYILAISILIVIVFLFVDIFISILRSIKKRQRAN